MENIKIFYNAKIYTIDKKRSVTNSIAIWNGKIISIGDFKKIKDDFNSVNSVFDKPKLIDLNGGTVLPGMTDSHIHLSSYADSLREIDLFRCISEVDVITTLKEKKKKIKKGEWIIGRGWSQNDWIISSKPSKNSLDKAFPDNPVLINSKCGHIIWVNSLALKFTNIIKNTKFPEGGEIEFDTITKEPTGILKENAIYLIWNIIPIISDDEKKIILLDAINQLLKNGITTIHIPDDIRTFSLLQELYRENKLKIRIHFLPPYSQLDNLINSKIKSSFGNEWIRMGGLKLFTDGSLGGRTAYMLESYEDDKKNFGICVTTEKELYEIVSKANKNGISTAIHAIGDRAVRETINVFVKMKKEGLTKNIFLPNRIEHFQCVHPDDLSKLKNAGIVASVQPIHLKYDINGIEKYWGKRGRYAYAFKSLKKAGCLLAFGSDGPVEDINPFIGIKSAVLRQDEKDYPAEGFYPEEKISLDEAIIAYTQNPAIVSGEENLKGTLEVGKLADFIIINKDIFKLNPDEIDKIKVLKTFVNGKEV